MNSCFPVAKLGSLCSKIGSGATPRGGSKVYLESGKFALIRSQNVRNDRFDVNGLVFIEEKNAKQLANVEVESADVLLNITGDSVARCCQVDSSILPARVNQHVAIIRPIRTKLDSQFLRYFLVSPEMQEHMLAWASSGATRNALTKGMIEGFNVPLPSLDEQNAIAHILGTLDKKIEVNRKVSATLEAMAQALFKSWFVDFDPVIDNALAEGNPIPEEFEVRAAARESLGDARKPLPEHLRQRFPSSFTHDEELGWIPEGWEVGNLGRIAKQKREGAKPTEIAEDAPYIGLQDMPRQSISLSNWGNGEEVTSTKSRFARGDILFGKLRPYFHKVGIAPVDGVCSTDIVVVAPRKDVWTGYTLCVCSSKAFVDYASAGSSGTKMPRTSWRDMAAYPLAIPPVSLASEFNDFVASKSAKIIKNILANRDLARTRDTLLPKLLTGEIRLPLETMELEVAI